MTSTTLPTLLTLPSELMETILICSRSPRTVAAVAQTCRTLRTLVYASPDSHLWRELFLTTWDDPRPAHEHRALVDPRVDLTVWDWGIEYRRRITAEKQLKAWRRGICLSIDEVEEEEETNEDWDAATLPALQAILDTLLTLRPFPSSPPIALTVLTPTISPYPTGNVGSGVGETRERMTSAPPLPPLLILLASGFSAFQRSRSAVRMSRMVYGPYTSRTIDGTTEAIATPSLPPQLVRTLMASHRVGVKGVPAHVPFLCGAEHWCGDVVGDLFHRIVCITGFVPIPPPLLPPAPASQPRPRRRPSLLVVANDGASTPTLAAATNLAPTPNPWTSTSASEDTEASKEGEDLETVAKVDQAHQTEPAKPQSDPLPKPRITKPFPTPSQQYDDARILARRRVYDMRYLRGDRLWGPFQTVTRESLSSLPGTGGVSSGRRSRDKGTGTSGATPTARRSGRLGTLAWAMGVDVEVGEQDSSSEDDDDDDEDWQDTTEEDAGASATSATTEDPMAVDAESEVEDEPVHPLMSFILANRIVDEPDTNATSTNSSSSRRRTRPSNPRLPPNVVVSPREIKPQHLKPDYTYLASVRIIVESNLRELFGSEISNIVGQSASEDRPGGVGTFWEDEDEILRARAVGAVAPSEPASSASIGVASKTSDPTIPSTTTPAFSSSEARAFELADILSHFKDLDVARIGSACGYWGGWIERKASTSTCPPGSVNTEVDVSSSSATREGGIRTRKPRIVSQRAELEGKPDEGEGESEGTGKGTTGKGKRKVAESSGAEDYVPVLGNWEVGPEGEACEGWDWAAVAGIWRRCVCWMDYRELLFFNLDSSKFLSLDTQEACRIIPMELRITGYTRSGLFPMYDTEPAPESSPSKSSTPTPADADAERTGSTGPSRKRPKIFQTPRTRYFRPPPVINFVGCSVGSDRGLDDGRTVRGSVQLIGGGEVRWQMESSSPGSSTPEWSSEAVQVGGIGSAVGLLGMWTGAGHERADPLGPFWAWKVS